MRFLSARAKASSADHSDVVNRPISRKAWIASWFRVSSWAARAAIWMVRIRPGSWASGDV
jgi:hypothetical protein